MRILLVDDDLELLDVTQYALQRSGHQIVTARDGAQALRRWEEDQPDVVVLDVGLPLMNGLEVCQEIRRRGPTPIILLTALGSEDSVVAGFRAGADDYVTKPFSTRVLAVRIQAVWSRTTGARTKNEPPRDFQVGAISVDMDSHEVERADGEVVRLTPIEYRILHMLVINEGRVVSSSRLVDYAWGLDGGDSSLLKTHISHIRKKIGLGAEWDVTAIPSVGYRLARTKIGPAISRGSLVAVPVGIAG